MSKFEIYSNCRSTPVFRGINVLEKISALVSVRISMGFPQRNILNLFRPYHTANNSPSKLLQCLCLLDKLFEATRQGLISFSSFFWQSKTPTPSTHQSVYRIFCLVQFHLSSGGVANKLIKLQKFRSILGGFRHLILFCW